MDAKYQKYYDALKGVDLTSKASSVVNGGTSLTTNTAKLDSQISASTWEELGYTQVKTVVVPAFIQAANTCKSNCDVLSNACQETSTLVSLLESLQSACSDYDSCPSDDEHASQKSSLASQVKSCESKVDSQITKIKGLNGNIKDIDINITTGDGEQTITADDLKNLNASTIANGEFVYYCQRDYKQDYGGGKTIASAGCGPTSLAMVLTYFTGKKVTPVDTAKYAMNHGYRVIGNGTDASLFGAMCKEYGISGSYQSPTSGTIINALKSGKKIIAHMGPGTFTSEGHYIVLKGVTSDGKVLVADPNHPEYNNKSFDPSIIVKESKGEMFIAG